MEQKGTKILYPELSYKVQGACMSVRKAIGRSHKETIYHNALQEELTKAGLSFIHEPSINIYYPSTGKKLGTYRPDFLIQNQILLELKALFPLPSHFITQAYDYVKNSEYELLLFINFGGPRLYIQRIIYTNDRKPFLTNFVSNS